MPGLLGVDPSLTKDRPDGSLRQVSAMSRDAHRSRRSRESVDVVLGPMPLEHAPMVQQESHDVIRGPGHGKPGSRCRSADVELAHEVGRLAAHQETPEFCRRYRLPGIDAFVLGEPDGFDDGLYEVVDRLLGRAAHGRDVQFRAQRGPLPAVEARDPDVRSSEVGMVVLPGPRGRLLHLDPTGQRYGHAIHPDATVLSTRPQLTTPEANGRFPPATSTPALLSGVACPRAHGSGATSCGERSP